MGAANQRICRIGPFDLETILSGLCNDRRQDCLFFSSEKTILSRMWVQCTDSDPGGVKILVMFESPNGGVGKFCTPQNAIRSQPSENFAQRHMERCMDDSPSLAISSLWRGEVFEVEHHGRIPHTTAIREEFRMSGVGVSGSVERRFTQRRGHHSVNQSSLCKFRSQYHGIVGGLTASRITPTRFRLNRFLIFRFQAGQGGGVVELLIGRVDCDDGPVGAHKAGRAAQYFCLADDQRATMLPHLRSLAGLNNCFRTDPTRIAHRDGEQWRLHTLILCPADTLKNGRNVLFFRVAVSHSLQILAYGLRMRLVDLHSAADNSCDIGAPPEAAPRVWFHDSPLDGLSRAPHFFLSRRIYAVVPSVGNVDWF